MLTPPKKIERPYHEYTGEMLRWYDNLMKNEEDGMLDEPPVKMYVSGIDRRDSRTTSSSTAPTGESTTCEATTDCYRLPNRYRRSNPAASSRSQ